MRKISFLFLVLALSISSCKKEDDNDNGNTPAINKWENITLPETTYQGGWLWATNIGNNIYIGNESNSGQYYQFFVRYDINTNSYTELPTNQEICACGYMSKLLTDNLDLYYFANGGVKFSASANTWSNVSYPSEFRNGEAGCGYLNGKIYYIGGRDFTKTVRYYDISTDSWDSLNTEYYYKTNSSAVIGYNNKLYVIGGNSEAEKKVSVFDPSTNTWNKNNDCPYSTDQHAVVYNNLIYVIGGDKLYTYDPVSDEWDNSYSLPSNMYGYTTMPIVYNSNLYIIGFESNSAKIAFYKFKE